MVAHPPFDKTGISGTELNRLIEKRNIKQWTRLSFASVYYTLNQLGKKKFIKAKKVEGYSNKQSDVGAPQKYFIITPRGRSLLKKTVLYYFQNLDLNYEEMNLALASAYVLSKKELLKIIRIHNKQIKKRVKIVHGRFEEDSEDLKGEEFPIHVWALFNYAFYSLNSRSKFLDELIGKLEQEIKSEMEMKR